MQARPTQIRHTPGSTAVDQNLILHASLFVGLKPDLHKRLQVRFTTCRSEFIPTFAADWLGVGLKPDLQDTPVSTLCV